MFRRKLACSFCGKRDFEVEKLVAGPRVYICDQMRRAGESDHAEQLHGRKSRPGPAGSLIQRASARLRQTLSRRHTPPAAPSATP